MCIAIPPKHPLASLIGYLKGKSAIAIARLCGKGTEFLGRTLLGPGLCRLHGRIRTGAAPANTSARRMLRASGLWLEPPTGTRMNFEGQVGRRTTAYPRPESGLSSDQTHFVRRPELEIARAPGRDRSIPCATEDSTLRLQLLSSAPVSYTHLRAHETDS